MNKKKDRNAVALGKRRMASMTREQRADLASIGGHAAAAKMTAEQRSTRARNAANARHAKKLQKTESDTP